jgi:5'(3')-deoxyribonucleotidase
MRYSGLFSFARNGKWSMMKNKTILLDVDGVVADFLGHVHFYLRRNFTSDLVDPDQYTEWDFIATHLTDQQRRFTEYLLSSEDFWQKIPVMPSARYAVDCFNAAEMDVHFVTSPYKTCFGWADVRRDWLKRNLGVQNDHIHVSGSKHIYNGAVFVDDKPQNIHAWAEANPGGKAFLFEHSYNRFFRWEDRIYGWDLMAVESVIAAAHKGA